jgi:hypothetical protein
MLCEIVATSPSRPAASVLGLPTGELYREWVTNGGWPKCGSTTTLGRLCENSIYPKGYRVKGPAEWLAAHRSECCHLHLKQEAEANRRGHGETEICTDGSKPPGEFKLNWQPSELSGEEFADIRGRGRRRSRMR